MKTSNLGRRFPIVEGGNYYPTVDPGQLRDSSLAFYAEDPGSHAPQSDRERTSLARLEIERRQRMEAE